MSLWRGRFKEDMHPLVKNFTFSAEIDKELFNYDIEGSIAHARMLAKCGIIKEVEVEKIIKSLREIEKDIQDGKIDFSKKEDIHMAIEEELIRREKDAGEKIHTARSRNDQIALDEKLYLREKIKTLCSTIHSFQLTLLDIAEANKDVTLPGCTHLQYAQPVSLAHHILAYFWMFERDKGRLLDCYKRVNVCPLGAAALAGTSLPIDREYTAKLLAFPAITENSIDTVSDRDYVVEFLSSCSIIMIHLSRFCEEIILWASPFFNFLEIGEGFSTGSSLMPHKKNPDVPELIRGKTGKVYAALISLLTIMKALPLSYNRDMQEDKFLLFQAADEVKLSLEIFTQLMKNLKFNTQKMRQKAEEGFFAATDLVEYLVTKGVPFRTAHRIVGKLVRWCIENKKDFTCLSLQEYKKFSPCFEENVKQRLSLEECVKNKNSAGGTGKKSLEIQIKHAREKLEIQHESFSLQAR
ncbi:argininosuccinate lyase [Candidatus Aerophobetes bacterium]|nr:argininosuccinate lyase [Candidatus Aerophobetes bacterium]